MFESEPRVTERGSPSLVGRGIANPQEFRLYLKAQNKRNIRQIISYVQRFGSILENDDASPLVNLQSSAVRRHAMEALTAYAKFSGAYENWCQIRKRYSLHWTNGNESVAAMQRFFDTNLSLDSMLSKVKEMIRVLPATMVAVIKFNVLTGLRPSEACESVRLLTSQQLSTNTQYYNQQQQ